MVYEEASWVVGRAVGPSTWITKSSLNFMAKALWMMVCHRLSPMNEDNILSPFQDSMVVGIMEGYEIDLAKLIVREIHNQVVSTNTTLVFSCLLTQICLDQGVPKLSFVD